LHSFASISASSPDTHIEMRRKPAFFIRRLYNARRSAFVVDIAKPHNLDGERLAGGYRQACVSG
jgi:hypothetical protein